MSDFVIAKSQKSYILNIGGVHWNLDFLHSTDPCAFRSRVFRLPPKCCNEHKK